MANGHCRAAAELRTIARVVVLQHDSRRPRETKRTAAKAFLPPETHLSCTDALLVSSARLQMIWLLVQLGQRTARADICCGVLLRFRVHAT